MKNETAVHIAHQKPARANTADARGCAANVGIAWTSACQKLIDAVSPAQRDAVQLLLCDPHRGGRGIRMWAQHLARSDSARLPAALPEQLVQIYLDDGEAVPLHDCERCGIALPVRPNRASEEFEPEHVYFPSCPVCGGRTGLYAFWSRDLKDGSAPEIDDGARLQRLRRIAR